MYLMYKYILMYLLYILCCAVLYWIGLDWMQVSVLCWILHARTAGAVRCIQQPSGPPRPSRTFTNLHDLRPPASSCPSVRSTVAIITLYGSQTCHRPPAVAFPRCSHSSRWTNGCAPTVQSPSAPRLPLDQAAVRCDLNLPLCKVCMYMYMYTHTT
jgi:hypothetical protein